MKVFFKVLIASCMVISGVLSAEGVKLGVVDIARAVQEVDDGIKAKAELQADLAKRQKAFDTKQEEVKKLQDSLNNQAAVMKPEARQKNDAELQRKMGELQQMYTQTQQEMAKQEQDKMAPILKKMNDILQTKGKEGKYDAVLRSEAVAFVKAGSDITEEVIRAYNDANKPKAKSGK